MDFVEGLIGLAPIGFLVLAGLIVFFSMVFTVEEKTARVVTRFGKFARIAQPGLNFKLPFIESIAGGVSLRIQQLDVEVETKTADNVFVQVQVSVQYQVISEKVKDAFYRLENSGAQITSYVFDVVRARVPLLKLDDVFEKKDEIADAVRGELAEVMDDYGFQIIKALVTDIDPDPKVKESMNAINAAQRMRQATVEKAEADRFMLVKAAEADSESKRLQGEGIAAQRRAIIDGLSESVQLFQNSVPGATANDVMMLVMMTQYFDTLQEIGAQSGATTIMLPYSPGALNDLMSQIQQTLISGNLASNPVKPASDLPAEPSATSAG